MCKAHVEVSDQRICRAIHRGEKRCHCSNGGSKKAADKLVLDVRFPKAQSVISTPLKHYLAATPLSNLPSVTVHLLPSVYTVCHTLLKYRCDITNAVLQPPTAVILYRVFQLWDDRKAVSRGLILGFAMCFGGAVAFAVLAQAQLSGVQHNKSQKFRLIKLNLLKEGLQFVKSINTCSFDHKSWYMSGLWATMVLHRVLLTWNILKPLYTGSV